jgi:hypothetical protein
VLREAGAPANARTSVRFTRNWARVRCLHADADVELLEGLEHEMKARLRDGVSARDPKAMLDVLEDTLSNSVQLSEIRGTLAKNLTTEMELLMRMYVEPLKVAGIRMRSGHAMIARAMRTEFQRAGVWGVMEKRIAASEYTRAGDPLRIDCGYRTTQGPEYELMRMFHAVSLDGGVKAAKVLAFSAPQLREGVKRVHGAGLQLTAVVETREGHRPPEINRDWLERYDFGVAAMERQEIRVLSLKGLAAAAATARSEMGIS